MKQTEAQLRASKKYNEKFHKLQIRVSHEEKEVIDSHIAGYGESVNAFVRRAIFETIERDQQKTENKSEEA